MGTATQWGKEGTSGEWMGKWLTSGSTRTEGDRAWSEEIMEVKTVEVEQYSHEDNVRFGCRGGNGMEIKTSSSGSEQMWRLRCKHRGCQGDSKSQGGEQVDRKTEPKSSLNPRWENGLERRSGLREEQHTKVGLLPKGRNPEQPARARGRPESPLGRNGEAGKRHQSSEKGLAPTGQGSGGGGSVKR